MIIQQPAQWRHFTRVLKHCPVCNHPSTKETGRNCPDLPEGQPLLPSQHRGIQPSELEGQVELFWRHELVYIHMYILSFSASFHFLWCFFNYAYFLSKFFLLFCLNEYTCCIKFAVSDHLYMTECERNVWLNEINSYISRLFIDFLSFSVLKLAKKIASY